MKERTKEEALEYLESRRADFEGTPSYIPGRICRRYGLETPQWVKDCYTLRRRIYMKTHPAQAIKIRERVKSRMTKKQRDKNRSDYYEANKDACNNRTYSYLFMQRNKLLKKGFEIHHVDLSDPSRFFYLPKEVHRTLHRLYGYKNEDVTEERVYASMDIIPEFMYFKDYKLVDSSEAR